MFLFSQTSNRTNQDDRSGFKCLLTLIANKAFKLKFAEMLAALMLYGTAQDWTFQISIFWF